MTNEKERPCQGAPRIASVTQSTGLGIPMVAPYTAGSDLTAAAMAYGKAGIYLAPTAATGQSPYKNPGALLRGQWQTQTVTGAADAYAMFGERFAAEAVGIACHYGRSGLVVFDIDTENASIVHPLILRAIKECEPPYFTTRVGAELRGQYLFQQPHGRMIGNTQALGTAWGDIRGKNGVGILPGSQHAAEDGEYAWQRVGAVPMLPQYLADALPTADDTSDAATDAEIAAFAATHGGDLSPGSIKGVITRFEREATEHGRHTSITVAAVWAMREVRAGLYTFAAAQEALSGALSKALRGERDHNRELQGVVAWAVGQALSATEERMA